MSSETTSFSSFELSDGDTDTTSISSVSLADLDIEMDMMPELAEVDK